MDGRAKLQPPDGHKQGLLHSCCAPCPGEAMEAMLASEIDFTIFFYNPNIHPQSAPGTSTGAKLGGAQRMIEISKREEFYRQEYCGCAYSLRDTDKRRRRQGPPPIAIGTQFYRRGHQT